MVCADGEILLRLRRLRMTGADLRLLQHRQVALELVVGDLAAVV